MFGYTILNDELELWFMDHTQLLVTNPIKWITVRESQLDGKSILIPWHRIMQR